MAPFPYPAPSLQNPGPCLSPRNSGVCVVMSWSVGSGNARTNPCFSATASSSASVSLAAKPLNASV